MKEKFLKFARWSFRGGFFKVWLKWMFISVFLVDIPLLSFIFYPHLPSLTICFIVLASNAYSTLIPTFISQTNVIKSNKINTHD